MVDVTAFLPGLSPVQGKAVVARFDGGRLSSEGGLLALHEIERRLGLADRLAGCLRPNFRGLVLNKQYCQWRRGHFWI
jgi:Transposase DDE domain group 1